MIMFFFIRRYILIWAICVYVIMYVDHTAKYIAELFSLFSMTNSHSPKLMFIVFSLKKKKTYVHGRKKNLKICKYCITCCWYVAIVIVNDIRAFISVTLLFALWISVTIDSDKDLLCECRQLC